MWLQTCGTTDDENIDEILKLILEQRRQSALKKQLLL